jgi:hypothetical protein
MTTQAKILNDRMAQDLSGMRAWVANVLNEKIQISERNMRNTVADQIKAVNKQFQVKGIIGEGAKYSDFNDFVLGATEQNLNFDLEMKGL